MTHHLRPRTQRPRGEPTPATATPIWVPAERDRDLAEATQNDPNLADWMEALASSSEATMTDSAEEQLYSQAPDALTQQGIEPTPEAIDDWVTRQLRRSS